MLRPKGSLIVLFAILITCLMVFTGCSQETNPVTTTNPGVGSSVGVNTSHWVSKIGGTKQVATGQEFTVTLNENPTTGYTWHANFDSSYLEQVSSNFVQSSTTGVVGAGGKRAIQFKALKKGLTSITMLLKRSGDEVSREVEVYLVAIDQPVGGTIVTEGEKEADVGKEFTLTLEENPTTGYAWEAVFDVSYLEQVSSDYAQASPGTIGGGGNRIFKFKALKQGVTALVLVLKRSWEETPLEIKVYTVDVKLLVTK